MAVNYLFSPGLFSLWLLLLLSAGFYSYILPVSGPVNM